MTTLREALRIQYHAEEVYEAEPSLSYRILRFSVFFQDTQDHLYLLSCRFFGAYKQNLFSPSLMVKVNMTNTGRCGMIDSTILFWERTEIFL